MNINGLAIMDAGTDGESAPWKEPPPPYQTVSGDLNDGAGGDNIYLAVTDGAKDQDSMLLPPITALHVIAHDKKRGSSNGPVPPDGYSFAEPLEGSVDKGGDLNGGAGGKFIYLCFSRLPGLGGAIQEIKVVAGGGEAPAQMGGGWQILHQDLNEGAGGDWIYFIYRR